MHINVVLQNVQHGGFADESGQKDDRLPLLFERINAARPDILVVNEARGWTVHDHAPLGRAMKALGMYAALPPKSSSDIGPLILVRWETMGAYTFVNNDLADKTTQGFTTVSFTIPGLPQPITIVGVHITPYSPTAAVAEADLAATRGYRKGSLSVVAGDFNYPPSDGPDPAYDIMLPFNKASRTLPGADGTGLRPNREIARAIEGRGYLDAGLHLYRKTGDERCLARTANDDRIDRIYVSDALGPALVDYELLDTPAGASDHHGVRVTLDTDLVPAELLWQYR